MGINKVIAFGLIILARIIRDFGAVQEKRSPLYKPLIWQSNIMSLTLVIIFLALLIAGLIIGYIAGGFKTLIILVIVFFFVLPTLFGDSIKKIMDKRGI